MPPLAADAQTVLLAALLHDIGKFAQRAGVSSPSRFDGFRADDYGPNGAHAKWSADFVEQHLPEQWRRCAHAVLTHHKPRDYLAKVIAVADHLASAERVRAPAGEHDPRSANLVSVFARLRLPRAGEASGELSGQVPIEETVYPLRPLALEREVIFPGAAAAGSGDYASLWRAFEEEATALRTRGDSFAGYLESLVHVLEKYTWCIPAAAYVSEPDVSLFDHLRVAAAIAVCLEVAHPPEAELDALLQPGAAAQDHRPRFSLVCGDLSSVQPFLYTITSRGAARGLRGRSLHLQLLTEAIAAFILDELGLPTVNQIYVGGGRFYLLAPPMDEERLAALRREVGARLLAAHGGQLSLALAVAPVAPADFGAFPAIWEEAGRRVGEAKGRRFAELATTDYERLFAPRGRGGPLATAATCDVCERAAERGTIRDGILRCAGCAGREPTGPVYAKRCDICREEVVRGEVDAGTVKCEDCLGFEELGQQLLRVRRDRPLYLTVSTEPVPPEAPGWQRALGRFGRRYRFGPPGGDRSAALAYRINDTDFLPHAHGFRFLNLLTPRVDQDTLEDLREMDDASEPLPEVGEVKSFAVLAHQSVGIHRMGILRMDVDSLGALFKRGLGKQASISRLATLSRMLRLFFEGWLNDLGERIEACRTHLPSDRLALAGQDRLYAIYAGGDDLFVVGSWDRLPLYARGVRQELAEFAGGNPALTISGGLVLAEAHAPLSLSADEARHALDAAKEHERYDGPRKDAIHLVGHTLGWEEFPDVEKAVVRLQALIDPADGPAVPRAILTALAEVAAQYDRDARGRPKGAKPGQIHYGRWCWLGAYTLQRQVERMRPGEVREQLKALVEELRRPELVPHLRLIARWTEFLVRTERRDAGP